MSNLTPTKKNVLFRLSPLPLKKKPLNTPKLPNKAQSPLFTPSKRPITQSKTPTLAQKLAAITTSPFSDFPISPQNNSSKSPQVRLNSRTIQSRLNRFYKTSDRTLLQTLQITNSYGPIQTPFSHPRDRRTPNGTMPKIIHRKRLSLNEQTDFSDLYLQYQQLLQEIPNTRIREVTEKFISTVSKDYLALFFQLDSNKKEFFELQDIKRWYLRQFSSGKCQRRCNIRLTVSISKLFELISNGEIFSQNSFLGLASVYQYSYPNRMHDFDLTSPGLVRSLLNQLCELKALYVMYFSNNKLLELQNIPDEEVKMALEKTVAKNIPFEQFLRFLPYFLWINRHLS